MGGTERYPGPANKHKRHPRTRNKHEWDVNSIDRFTGILHKRHCALAIPQLRLHSSGILLFSTARELHHTARRWLNILEHKHFLNAAAGGWIESAFAPGQHREDRDSRIKFELLDGDGSEREWRRDARNRQSVHVRHRDHGAALNPLREPESGRTYARGSGGVRLLLATRGGDTALRGYAWDTRPSGILLIYLSCACIQYIYAERDLITKETSGLWELGRTGAVASRTEARTIQLHNPTAIGEIETFGMPRSTRLRPKDASN
ncbi:hypothetical protein FB451DRAFT_1171908 [Mycena latifolia]|nr:hypothetical protein FB451DRAFT_1171908 [Mycena latifolia]